MKKKYTLKEFYELERKIFELRISVKKGNFSNELREKLRTKKSKENIIFNI